MPLRFECPAKDCEEVRDVLPDMVEHCAAEHPEIHRDAIHGRFVPHGKTAVYLARCAACATLRESTQPLPNLCDACQAAKEPAGA